MPSTLEFDNVHYWVNNNNEKTGDLHILKGVSGKLESGRLFAILGSSGSGKSTLLDCLAQRKESGHWTGSVRFNGEQVSSSSSRWRRSCGYVLQHDRLLASATVFETLMFSSQLRTPYGKSQSFHEEKVADVLEELSLSHRRNSRIGNETKKVLSGGEIRRVSIGQELVADCKVLLLDEPTSGLDYKTALNIVELLRAVCAQKDRIVAATIHQPSSSITELFEDMMLLAHGQVCYFGPMSDCVEHFSRIGFPVPMYMNPTDFIMDLSHDQEKVQVMKNNYSGVVNPSSPNEHKSEYKDEQEPEVEECPTPFWYQFRLIWLRNFRQWYRDELLLASEVSQYLFCGLFIGGMYYQFPDSLTDGIFDRMSAIFFILTTICFIPSFTVVTMSGEEMPLIKRETKGGMYSLSASYLAKMATSWPFEIVLVFLFLLPSYWLAGFQADAVKFFEFAAITIVFLLTSETIGLLCATASKTPTIGVLVLSLVLLVCLAVGGFLVSQPKPAFTWFEKINFFVFAYTAMLNNQFSDLVLYAADGTPVTDVVQVLRDEGRVRNNLSIWENVLVMLAILVVCRLGSFYLLRKKLFSKTVKRSATLPSTLAHECKAEDSNAAMQTEMISAQV